MLTGEHPREAAAGEVTNDGARRFHHQPWDGFPRASAFASSTATSSGWRTPHLRDALSEVLEPHASLVEPPDRPSPVASSTAWMLTP